MPVKDTVETVVRTIVEHARIRPPEVQEHHVLTRDLGFDSLAMLLTLGDLEQRLGFEYPVERLDDLSTISVAELIGMVRVDSARRQVGS